MEGSECKECGYFAVVNHDGYLVCEECSTVQGEDMITCTAERHDIDGYKNASDMKLVMQDNNKIFRLYNNKSYGEWYSESNIKVYGKIFNFTPVMIEHANNMYSTLYRDPDILHKHLKHKISLSFGCLFFVGRKNNSVVSLKRFGEVAQVPIPNLVESLKLITNKLHVELPVKSIIEITIEITCQHNISTDIRKTTLDILHVCDRAWLLTGRQPQKSIWAAIYIASKSINIVELNKVTFSKFMQSYQQAQSLYSDGSRLKEMLQVLTDLGQHIPWASNKGEKTFVFCNLRDIIRYSEMAMKDKKRELIKALEVENDTTRKKRKFDDNDEDLDIYHPPILKHPKNKPVTTETDYDEISLGHHIDCEPEDLGPEIDNELDNYIRLPEEVIEIEKARELIIDGI